MMTTEHFEVYSRSTLELAYVRLCGRAESYEKTWRGHKFIVLEYTNARNNSKARFNAMMTTKCLAVIQCLFLMLPMFGFAEEPNPEKELPARIITQTIQSLILSGKYEEALIQGGRFLRSPAAELVSVARRETIENLVEIAVNLTVRERFNKKSLASFTVAEGKNGAIRFVSDAQNKWHKIGDEYENAKIIFIEEKRAVLVVAHARIWLDFEVEIPDQNKP